MRSASQLNSAGLCCQPAPGAMAFSGLCGTISAERDPGQLQGAQ